MWLVWSVGRSCGLRVVRNGRERSVRRPALEGLASGLRGRMAGLYGLGGWQWRGSGLRRLRRVTLLYPLKSLEFQWFRWFRLQLRLPYPHNPYPSSHARVYEYIYSLPPLYSGVVV